MSSNNKHKNILALSQIPPLDNRRIAVHITPAAERAVRGGHPWLFADSLVKQSFNGRAGDITVIFDRKNRFLAVGLYDAQGPIRVRILHVGDPVTIDGIWLRAQLAAAAARRTPLLQTNSIGHALD
ncbi:MAG: hypothetical protein GY796_12030, partial [Chloroflexi bacterium]|nr:hypothetical protein [Chloroflexota bacterium]